MDQEILDILEEEALYHSQMAEEYETRLGEYGELRQSVQAVLDSYSEEDEIGEEEREDRMMELLDIQDEVQEKLSEGLPGEAAGDPSALTLGMNELFEKLNAVRESAGTVEAAEWTAQVRDLLVGYLDFIDAVIDDIEADRERLASSRLRFETLRLILGQEAEA